MKTIEHNGKIRRVSDTEAFKLVDKQKIAKYVAKSVYKTIRGKVEKKTDTSIIDASTAVIEKPKKEKKEKKEKKSKK